MMPSQRVRDAGIRAGNKSSNGPQRAWGTAEPSIRDVRAYVSCREPVGAPQRGSIAANQGGTADRAGMTATGTTMTGITTGTITIRMTRTGIRIGNP